MVRFSKVNYCDIKGLRNQYLSSIYEAQELFLEFIIMKSDCFIIEDEAIDGYFIISPEYVLIEYYVSKNKIQDAELIFNKVVKDFHVRKVYCKSFDSILLKCCVNNELPYKVIGTLFRDFFDTEPDTMTEFFIRKGRDRDIPNLLKYTDGLYESEEELYQLIKGENILMYYLNNELIGCGFLIRTTDDRSFYDIGMWVNSSYRRKGFGTRIIAHLKGYCLENNMVPICGCAVDNQASRKTLEKNGFFSKHDLIEFAI